MEKFWQLFQIKICEQPPRQVIFKKNIEWSHKKIYFDRSGYKYHGRILNEIRWKQGFNGKCQIQNITRYLLKNLYRVAKTWKSNNHLHSSNSSWENNMARLWKAKKIVLYKKPLMKQKESLK